MKTILIILSSAIILLSVGATAQSASSGASSSATAVSDSTMLFQNVQVEKKNLSKTRGVVNPQSKTNWSKIKELFM
jgi:hypothetical protein